ncbi:XRE family transcriptional regulator [Nocardiopsis akebiae]|uniref:XRE family transcriptional regulator n=1 Tax=Nocardiopsis akebiae TaxID=2831968 RepID=A0ABX8CAN5_9ACTN|nr:helix-turn-helix domain-containing protein [Nocardiopsis akebiae]QUX29618.1 XRE family transcriptional regulator [Nocardiopsis akebiae]
MKGRSWREIQAEAEKLNPWLTSAEAQEIADAETARIEAERQGYALSSPRKESGRTRKEVAQVMGVSQARISQIEHGRIDSLELLRSYISAIGGELHLRVDQGPLSVTLDIPGSDAAAATATGEGADASADERDAV